jgi:hypothetical protein
MSYASPRFWAQPLQYLRWASRERPAYFWSLVIGTVGPIEIFAIPPLRAALFKDSDPPQIPVTYPGESPSVQASMAAPSANPHDSSPPRPEEAVDRLRRRVKPPNVDGATDEEEK